MATTEKTDNPAPWGIDLAGRKMCREPWPLGDDGGFRQPSAAEREEVYGISGEAVRETLLYFEERAGVELADTGGAAAATARLVSLLNEHAIGERYFVTRENLLDAARWYDNEYYFYFIMFTKKVMGRYDFHFGENGGGLLSVHHQIYERGFMRFLPWGADESGSEVRDKTINNNLVLLIYLEDVCKMNTDDFIGFVNGSIGGGPYRVDRKFYEQEVFWVSAEFIEFGYAFFVVLTGRPKLLSEAAHYSSYTKLRMARLMLNVPKMLAARSADYAISKTNNVLDYSVKEGINSVSFRMTVKSRFDVRQYAPYVYSSAYHNCLVNVGAMKTYVQYVYKVAVVDVSSEIDWNGEDTGFSITYYYNRLAHWRFLAGFMTLLCLLLVVGSISWFVGNPLLRFALCSMLILPLLVLYIRSSSRNKLLLDQVVTNYKTTMEQFEAYERTSFELLQEKKLLEKRVHERTRDLALANDKLKELDKVKSEFFANISHELRTPLTLILAPVEAAASSGGTIGGELLDSLRRNASHLLVLINDLLDLSKLDAGCMALVVSREDVASLAAERAGLSESSCAIKGITLETDLPGSPVMAWIDADRMAKVLDNLLSNALKFTDGGGRITVRVTDSSDGCVIAVMDTGIGIPADKRGTIFDRFSQIDPSSTRRYEGTGIGLSLVREFTELHGGTVAVENMHSGDGAAPAGTCFIVRLPGGKGHFEGRDDVEFVEPGRRRRREMNDRPGPVSVRERAADFNGMTNDSSPRLLVVEDNADMHRLLDEILGGEYRIVAAMNGAEALEALETMEEPPDLVLADVMMPAMDGYEMTERLRGDERFRGIPVILLTARADASMKIEGLERGATDYVVKPFNAGELVARVRAQLRMKEQRDKLERANRELYRRLAEEGGKRRSVGATAEEKAERVIEFIKENFRADLSREGMAAAVDMSPDHLSRAFNKVAGKGLPDYVNELRVREAARMLGETGDTVVRISFDVGFDNLRSFNRAFKAVMGMTPSEYRKGRN